MSCAVALPQSPTDPRLGPERRGGVAVADPSRVHHSTSPTASSWAWSTWDTYEVSGFLPLRVAECLHIRNGGTTGPAQGPAPPAAQPGLA